MRTQRPFIATARERRRFVLPDDDDPTTAARIAARRLLIERAMPGAMPTRWHHRDVYALAAICGALGFLLGTACGIGWAAPVTKALLHAGLLG